jgi:hypothetical protein
MSLQDKADIKRLRAALDAILNGPMLDQNNHDFDQGLSAFAGRTGNVHPRLLTQWEKIAIEALKAS